MDSSMEVDSDEYEYEYHETETESFYLNLDLTSANGPIRPPRKWNEDPQESHLVNEPREGLNDPIDDDTYATLDNAEAGTLPGERIQILGLHTCNPIISYQNQIFSCSWADQIGTELVFTHPDIAPDTDYPPLRQGPSFELLAANSVKILGRKANIISSSGPRLVPENANTSNSISTNTDLSNPLPADPAGMTLGPETSTHQSSFIQRLQRIKHAHGEADAVRTIMSTRRNATLADRLNAWARTEAQVAEIASLNERAANGEEEALDILEMMIRRLDENDSQNAY
ncbi:hypothetical protein N7490_000595 [Penicillium lividum]|nr:hypothetical protein N7490_000595 [Penicillium lividum]